MEITLTEALRIKNELSNAVKELSYGVHQSSFGNTTEDGEVISEDKESFLDVEDRLIQALGYSESLNNSISSFNKDCGVDSTVRKMQNAKLLLDIYSRNLQRTKPTKTKRFENLGTVRKSVEIEYTPLVSSTDMKGKISRQKAIIRDLQSQVEKSNQSRISVEFSYADIESLIA